MKRTKVSNETIRYENECYKRLASLEKLVAICDDYYILEMALEWNRCMLLSLPENSQLLVMEEIILLRIDRSVKER